MSSYERMKMTDHDFDVKCEDVLTFGDDRVFLAKVVKRICGEHSRVVENDIVRLVARAYQLGAEGKKIERVHVDEYDSSIYIDVVLVT